MREDDLRSRLVCMATGAVVLAAGAVLGVAAGPYKEPLRRTLKGRGNGLAVGPPEGGRGCLVSEAAQASQASAMNGRDPFAETLTALETRLQAREAFTSERLDILLHRLVHLEDRLEQVAVERSQAPLLETLITEAQAGFAPRVTALEDRLEEHDATVRQLQASVSGLEAKTTERLAEQMSPAPPVPSDDRTEKAPPSRWKVFALAGAMAAVLLGGWTTFRLVDRRFLRLEHQMEQVDLKLPTLGTLVAQAENRQHIAVLNALSEKHEIALQDLQARISPLEATVRKVADQVRTLLLPGP